MLSHQIGPTGFVFHLMCCIEANNTTWAKQNLLRQANIYEPKTSIYVDEIISKSSRLP